MNYKDYIQELGVLLPQILVDPFNGTAPFTDNNYNTLIPRAIEYAENLIYSDPDLNFLYERKVDTTSSFTAGSRNFTIPTSINIVERIAAVVPNHVAATAGTMVQYLETSLDYIDFIWPQQSLTQTPSTAVGSQQPYFAMLDDRTAVLAPTPDAGYRAVVTGLFTPQKLQQTSSATTYLTTNYPSLFVAASMMFWAGAQRNYGQQSDDPRMALSWQQQYELIKKGVVVDAAKARSESVGWTPYSNTPVATPPRK